MKDMTSDPLESECVTDTNKQRRDLSLVNQKEGVDAVPTERTDVAELIVALKRSKRMIVKINL